MEKFDIVSFTEKEIVLTSFEDVDKFYNDLRNDDAVQLCWVKDGKKQSVVIMTTVIAGKIKNNEMVIKSEEKI